jgi:pimeloyl-ACP methyl ester carboxylesterase
MGKILKTLAVMVGAVLAVAAAAYLVLQTPDIPASELEARYGGEASRFIMLPSGVRVHVRDEGPRDAPVIMLIHGANESLHSWQTWSAALSPRWRVVRMDVPGHGLTGPAPDGDYSTPAMVAFVDEVRTALRIDRAAVAGHSMGGAIAWRYALAHPDHVSGLILVAAAGAPPPPGADSRGRPLAFRIAANPFLGPIFAKITPRSLVEEGLAKAFADPGAVPPELVTRIWELARRPGNREATLRRITAPRDAAAFEDVGRVGAPTLLLWGDTDRITDVTGAGAFKRRMPRAEDPIIYEGVGHLPQVEAGADSAGDAAAFLERIGWTTAAPAP